VNSAASHPREEATKMFVVEWAEDNDVRWKDDARNRQAEA
jgi:hypothetical protein